MKTTLQDFNLSNNKITFLASLSLNYFNRKKIKKFEITTENPKHQFPSDTYKHKC